MTKQASDAVLAALRPVVESLIRHDDVRRDREHDLSHDKSGKVRAERLSGNVPPNQAGVIQATAVQVGANAVSESENLGQTLTDIAEDTSKKTGQGLAADRPVAPPPGSLYHSTDTEVIERFDGADWQPFSASGLTIEEIQDLVSVMLVAGDNISLVYSDGAGTLTISAIVHSWGVLTDGDLLDPQIIFMDGEVVMVEGD